MKEIGLTASKHEFRFSDVSETSALTFLLYLAYVLVEFISLGVRYSFIGSLRPSLLLFGIIFALIAFQGSFNHKKDHSFSTKLMWLLMAYILVSLPFVEWPGSVIKVNFKEFMKAVVFFFFTIQVIDTVKRLRIFILIVIACQIWRVLEPLFLHVTEGYWGSATYGSFGMMLRLSGAPSDFVNSNGLGFLIITALPFLHYLLLGSRRVSNKICYGLLLPPLMYALILTGSRSALIGLFVVFGMFFWKSNKKAIFIVLLSLGFVAAIPSMSSEQIDRFVSLVDEDSVHAGTAQGRVRGMIREFEVGMNRPIFGHGLGTGREAKWNVRGGSKVPHNMYAEAFIELGAIGLILLCVIIFSFIRNAVAAREAVLRCDFNSESEDLMYLRNLSDAIHVWMVMGIVISIAQGGVSEFHWYLFGGISVVLFRLSSETLLENTSEPRLSSSAAQSARPLRLS